MAEITEFGIELPKNKVNKALSIAGNWTGEFCAIVSMIPFVGGIIASLTKYFVYFFAIIGIFVFGIVGSVLGGVAGGIWYGILLGIKIAKRMFYSVTGKPENPDDDLFMNPFKGLRKRKSNVESLER